MSEIRIEPWSEAGLELLRRVNTAEMKKHLGGPETDEQVLVRHQRYLNFVAQRKGCMFRILLGDEPVGTVGYGERQWDGAPVYEMGWAVLPPYQGRGIATAAVRAAVGRARAERRHRYLHAFPGVGNPPSNAVCRKAGFTLIGGCDFEFPPGRFMRSNDWRLDLLAAG
jgi:RimJ/RimL family protein N-acetyltransferase